MPTSSQNQKQKGAETRILEAARRIYPHFPSGDIEPFEEPDLRINTGAVRLGVEVTELVRPPQGNGFRPVETERLHQEIVQLAETYYRDSGAAPADVRVYFLDEDRCRLQKPKDWLWLSDKKTGSKREKMARALCDFVKDRYIPGKVTTVSRRSELPIGFEIISVASPLRGSWCSSESGSIGPLTGDYLASIIKAKNDLLPKYRTNMPNCPIWLLIFSSPSIAKGVAIPRVDGWRLAFDFEKVLLFSGMDNQVFDIGRL